MTQHQSKADPAAQQERSPTAYPQDCLPNQMPTANSLSCASTDGLPPTEMQKVGGGLIGSAPYRCRTLSVMHWLDSLTPQERESFYSETEPPK